MTVTVNFTLAGGKDEPAGVPGGVKVGEPGKPPPKKIVDVKPIYPEDAKREGIEGTVILEATIEETGLVSGVKILRSVPKLDQAAIDAVKQWQFEPQTVPKVMTMTVRFALDGKPAKLQFPAPPYPAEAIAAKVEGKVTLDAVIGVSGKVVSVKLVDGPSLLAQSAIAAVRQLEFRDVTSPQTARIQIEYRLGDGKPWTGWTARLSPMK